ncbi:MAG: GreA/GreB family elongation factor [Myxococcota bacterium]
MAPLPSKAALKDELVRLLTAQLDVAERAQRAAREGATHEEAKPENDKDTRGLEQSYLARGQALRVEELRAELGLVQGLPVKDLGDDAPVALGAVVTVEDDAATSVYFLAPAGGGAKLAGGRVQVVTPKSPLGQALLGKREGDSCDVRLAGRVRELTVTRVA